MQSKQNMSNFAGMICKKESFTLKGAVGSGEFKQTFAVEGNNGDKFALKVYFPSMERERPQREIEAISSCNHSNIAKFFKFDVLKDGENEYFWSLEEYLDGGTLGNYIQSGSLDYQKFRTVIIQLISAVEHIQSKNLVHRDLKPENILFRSATKEAVIIDFGLVRDLSKVSITATWQAHGPGTYYFAAPEQMNNEKLLIDWRSDQFALGVIYSIAMLGLHPYDHGQDKPGIIVTRVAAKEKQSPTFIKRATDLNLPQLIKMTEPWPVSRYRTPEALLNSWK